MTELNEEERRRRVDTGMYDAAFFMIAHFNLRLYNKRCMLVVSGFTPISIDLC